MQKAYSRPFLWVLAALGILSGAVAHAQVNLNSLAPNTVVGRLGAGQTGGAQAIPFATLLANLNGLPTLISGPGSVTSGHVVTWGGSNVSLLDSGIASSLIAINATASPAAGCVQFDGSSHLTSTGANCGNAGATAPGGSSGQFQYNSSGAFAGAASFTFSGSTTTSTGPFILNNSGGALPASPFGVTTMRIGLASGAGGIGIEMYGANGTPTFLVAYSQGTIAAPTATTTGNMYVQQVDGWDATNGYSTGAQISVAATQTWTATAHGTQIVLRNTPNGSTAQQNVAVFDQDASLTLLGALTVPGQLTATATNNNVALVTGTGSANRTTLVSDTSRALLHGDNSHNLISDTSFGVWSNGLNGCVTGCSSNNDANNTFGALAVTGPGMVLAGTNPTIGLIGTNANQLLVTNAILFAAAGGTTGSPTATNANAVAMMQLSAEGWNGSAWQLGVNIGVQATETWNGTSNGAQINFYANGQGTTYGNGSLVATMDGGLGLIARKPLVLDAASAATTVNGSDISLGNTTAVSSNCGSLAGGAACLKFYIGSTPHYIPYF